MSGFLKHLYDIIERHRLLAVVSIGTAAATALFSGLLSLNGLFVLDAMLLCALVALVMVFLRPPKPTYELSRDLELPLLLASDETVFLRYRRLAELIFKISRRHDPIYRAIAIDQVDDVVQKLTTIAAGTLVYESTEAWRIVYERLLRSTGLYLYRSVAWVKDIDYWQDEPGRRSMALNYSMRNNDQLNIERIAILADHLWPEAEASPVQAIRPWIHEQHAHGIWIKIVRESAIRHEANLLVDMGIYGSRALGVQELDEHCRTLRFVLTFDYAKVVEAESRWSRLSIFAESYQDHLDRLGLPG